MYDGRFHDKYSSSFLDVYGSKNVTCLGLRSDGKILECDQEERMLLLCEKKLADNHGVCASKEKVYPILGLNESAVYVS